MKKLILGYQSLLDKKAPKEEISLFLIQNGIDESKVDNFCQTYELGFKSGINHVITKGLSSSEIIFGQDPVFDSAFNMGKHIFRKESSLLYKFRFVGLGVVIALIMMILKGKV